MAAVDGEILHMRAAEAPLDRREEGLAELLPERFVGPRIPVFAGVADPIGERRPPGQGPAEVMLAVAVARVSREVVHAGPRREDGDDLIPFQEGRAVPFLEPDDGKFLADQGRRPCGVAAELRGQHRRLAPPQWLGLQVGRGFPEVADPAGADPSRAGLRVVEGEIEIGATVVLLHDRRDVAVGGKLFEQDHRRDLLFVDGFVEVQDQAGKRRVGGEFGDVELRVSRRFAHGDELQGGLGVAPILVTEAVEGPEQDFALGVDGGPGGGETEGEIDARLGRVAAGLQERWARARAAST